MLFRSGFHREFRDRDLVTERIALAAEAAAVRGGDDPDVGGRHLQHLGQGPMDVVGRLRARPEGQLAVPVDIQARELVVAVGEAPAGSSSGSGAKQLARVLKLVFANPSTDTSLGASQVPKLTGIPTITVNRMAGA